MRVTAFLAALLLAGPALALDPAAKSVTCAAAVTTGIGGDQQLRDLAPAVLPVLPYKAVPGEREFRHLTSLGDVPIRLSIYRVNENRMHMRIYEDGAAGPELLADMPLSGELAELSYRPLGSDMMVTVYCY